MASAGWQDCECESRIRVGMDVRRGEGRGYIDKAGLVDRVNGFDVIKTVGVVI